MYFYVIYLTLFYIFLNCSMYYNYIIYSSDLAIFKQNIVNFDKYLSI